jgi:ribosomal protein S18 acetylase RimI-like enzyme
MRAVLFNALAELGLYRRLILFEATPKPGLPPDSALELGFLGEEDLRDVAVAPDRLRRGDRCFGGRTDEGLVVTMWLARSPASVAYLEGTLALKPDEIYLYALHTHERQRARGAATTLVRGVLPRLAGECTRAVVAVLPENYPALKAVRSAGFTPFATIGWVGLGRRRRWFRRDFG